MNKSSLGKYCFVFLILVLFFLYGYNLVNKALLSRVGTEVNYHQTEKLDSSEKSGLWFECEKPEFYWESGDFVGAQYDLVLFNHLDYEINDWEIRIKVPRGSYLDATWNGVFQLVDDNLFISSVSYNSVIKKQAYPIGFIMYIPAKDAENGWNLTDISITYKKFLQMQDLTFYWVLLGFGVLITIFIIIYGVLKIKVNQARKQQKIYRDIIEQSLTTFANTIDAKDNYTEGHSRRVAFYSRELAQRLNLSFEEQEQIYYIAMMHDIGKIGIPDSILKKPTKLTEEEWEIMKKHSTYSGDILSEFTAIPEISSAVRYHHEWFDGTGYPYKLKGEEIPRTARIISVADSFDTMNSKRVYRGPLPKDEIIRQLRNNAGIQFDPEIVPHMIKMLEDGTVDRLNALLR